jgi:hypothetical protein
MKHTTKSHVTLSSMSKHFFALSLLVAFSFNAFSVDNSQQTNKEAYIKNFGHYIIAQFCYKFF